VYVYIHSVSIFFSPSCQSCVKCVRVCGCLHPSPPHEWQAGFEHGLMCQNAKDWTETDDQRGGAVEEFVTASSWLGGAVLDMEGWGGGSMRVVLFEGSTSRSDLEVWMCVGMCICVLVCLHVC